VPTHECLGPDDCENLQDKRKPAIQLDKEPAIIVREPDATRQPTPHDIQLMSKHRVLSFKPHLRLEWRGQDGQSETEQPDHSASLGDSITSSTRIRFSVHTGGIRRAESLSCHVPRVDTSVPETGDGKDAGFADSGHSESGQDRELIALGPARSLPTPGGSLRRSLLVPVRVLAVARIRANNRPSSIGAIDLKKAKVAGKTGKRREWTKADLKELKDHSKARTPLDKISKLTKRTVGSLRQKALILGIGLGHRR
jgi:hypothetical protein